jgi:ATP-binding cassette subfamily F protein 3
MSLLTAREISLSFGAKVLLDQASFSVNARDRIGLVGANGTGKTTLLKILSGAVRPESGTVELRRGVRIGYLPQDVLELPEGPLLETVLAAVPDRARLSDGIQATEAALARAQDDEEQLDLAEQLADLHEELAAFEERYGRHQAERILFGLGFGKADLQRPVAELSGGWKMRAALAGLLLTGPDLLLLDEPTNHLDVPSLVWFDEFLRRSVRAVVLVSHDRHFLNRQIDRVLAFEVEGLRGYSGNYDDYRRQRLAEEQELEARARRQAAERAEVEAFIERFRAKATKARQVQSRIRRLEREQIIRAVEARATIHFTFPEAPRSGREVLCYREVEKSFGDKVVYRGISQTLLRGERVAVIGANGAGKSTLLKLAAGELAADRGSVELGHQVQCAYFAQHHTELLDPSRTVLEEVWSVAPDQPQAWVRSILGAFLFTGDEVEKRIAVLSGGERARVTLARLLVVPSNLLLMDEPTNHLDLDSSEKLIAALQDYRGTLLFVSHNRSFVNGLATRIWDVRQGSLVDFPGNLDDYLYHCSELSSSASDPKGDGSPDAGARDRRPSERERRRQEALEREALNARLRPIRHEVVELEARIAQLEAEQRGLEPRLADPAIYQNFTQSRPLTEAYAGNKAELEQLYSRWEAAQQRLEATRKET